jgi:uncharacterized protein (TIGR02001 family)
MGATVSEGHGMTLRQTLPGLAALAVLTLAAPAVAQEAVSFDVNIGVTSDYVFRGVSQTDEGVQVFGGADVSAGQFYAGVWASNVDFNDSTDAEYDLYVGYKPTLGVVSMDLGVLYYGYVDQPPGADLDYFEFKAAGSLPLGPATLGAAAYYSPNYYAGVDHALYYEINGSYSPTTMLSFSAALGRQQVDGAGDYTTWNIGVGYALNDHLSVDLRYHDTDKHRLGDIYGSRAVVSLKAAF